MVGLEAGFVVGHLLGQVDVGRNVAQRRGEAARLLAAARAGIDRQSVAELVAGAELVGPVMDVSSRLTIGQGPVPV